MKFTITRNPEFNSTEISFEGKPSEAIRNALKDLRFRWHNLKKVWYGYRDESEVIAAIAKTEKSQKAEDTFPVSGKKAEKTNKYGVEVGDIFSSSWGWEQTNVDFFQVIEIVGETSVRVREVYLPMVKETPTCAMAADREYKLTKDILPPAPRSVFIEDQEKGDLKRIKPGYGATPEEERKNCSFKISSFASAYKCSGETFKTYESWYA